MNSRCRKRLVGFDVSHARLEACAESAEGERRATFNNDEAGHRALIKWVGKNARICLEATGVYHLPLCLRLRRAGVEVMVVNPRVARDFANSLSVRTKTDKVDAKTLLEYIKRMDFVAWEAPSAEVLELRDLARRLDDLVQSASDEKKRAHSFTAGGASRLVCRDVDEHIEQLGKRIKAIEKSAVALIRKHESLNERYRALLTIKGVGIRSAILLLAELLPLDPTMTVRELVAYAGLDPRQHDSGSSVHKQPRISRIGNARLRATLFLPAMTLSTHDANARHFRDRLMARGKKKMQAIVAVMRKLLHAVWSVMQRRTTFDSSRLFPLDAAALSTIGRGEATAESTDSAIHAPQPESKTSHPKGRSEAEEPSGLTTRPAEATRAR